MTSTADRSTPGTAPSVTETLAARAGGTRATRRGRDAQRRLVDAALEMFNTRPFHETRIVDITKAAGMAAGSFYTYFPSKEALFQVVAQHVLVAMYEAPRRDLGNTEADPVGAIAHASREYFRACLKYRMVAQSIEQLRVTDRKVGTSRHNTLLRGVKRTAKWVRRLQDEGICNPELDAWYTAMALQAMNVSMAYDQLVHRDEPDDVEALVAAVTPIWASAVGLDR